MYGIYVCRELEYVPVKNKSSSFDKTTGHGD